MVLEPKFDPGRALELIEQHQVTIISGVPTTYQLLCEHPDWAATDISSLQKLTCGGSAVPAAGARGLRGTRAGLHRRLRHDRDRARAPPAAGSREVARRRPGRRGCRTSSPTSGSPTRWATSLPARGGRRDPDPGPQRDPPSTGTGPRPRRTRYADGGWFRSGDMGYVDHGRLPVHLRPAQGHDHLRRGEHLPGRGRAGHPGARGRQQRRP